MDSNSLPERRGGGGGGKGLSILRHTIFIIYEDLEYVIAKHSLIVI